MYSTKLFNLNHYLLFIRVFIFHWGFITFAPTLNFQLAEGNFRCASWETISLGASSVRALQRCHLCVRDLCEVINFYILTLCLRHHPPPPPKMKFRLWRRLRGTMPPYMKTAAKQLSPASLLANWFQFPKARCGTSLDGNPSIMMRPVQSRQRMEQNGEDKALPSDDFWSISINLLIATCLPYLCDTNLLLKSFKSAHYWLSHRTLYSTPHINFCWHAINLFSTAFSNHWELFLKDLQAALLNYTYVRLLVHSVGNIVPPSCQEGRVPICVKCGSPLVFTFLRTWFRRLEKRHQNGTYPQSPCLEA